MLFCFKMLANMLMIVVIVLMLNQMTVIQLHINYYSSHCYFLIACGVTTLVKSLYHVFVFTEYYRLNDSGLMH